MATTRCSQLRLALTFLILLASSQEPSRAQQADETKLGTPITALPYTISAPGVYVLTQDYLNLNLANGTAIQISASDVVLDLNGHTISNTAAGADTTAYGVYASDQANVAVRNGTIQGFMTGVALTASNLAAPGTTSYAHLVEGLNVNACTYDGISLGGADSTVRSCQVTNIGGSKLLGEFALAYGIDLTGSGLRCLDCDVSQVTSSVSSDMSFAIYLGAATDVFATDNRLSAAGYGLYFDGASTGKYRHNLATDILMEAYVGGTDAGNNIVDSNGDGVDDDWELKYFSTLAVNLMATASGCGGLTNLQAYQLGLNPNDYYNGDVVTINLISGNDQTGMPGVLAAQPLVVSIIDRTTNTPRAYAPVTYQVIDGTMRIGPASTGPWGPTCAVRTDATGRATIYGQWPANAFGNPISSILVSAGISGAFFTETAIKPLAAGPYHTLAIDQTGTVWSWGYNLYGQLGNNMASSDWQSICHVTGADGTGYLDGITAVAAGGYHSLALHGSDGTVWSWGYNGYGELGDGTSTQRLTPVQVLVQGSGGTTSPLTGVVAIAAGIWHSLALKSDGTIWAWGYNVSGDLGDNTNNGRNTAVQVLGPGGTGVLSGVSAIAAGDNFSVALKGDGGVWAWGTNGNRQQLGNGGTADSPTPVQVINVSGVIAIAVGPSGSHTLALKSDGTVWAWGSDVYGQTGNEFEELAANPAQVVGIGAPVASGVNPSASSLGLLSGVVGIAAGDGHSVALLNDGRVCAWGHANVGQAGNNTTGNNGTGNSDYPEIVTSTSGTDALSGIAAVSAGGDHTIAATLYRGVPVFFAWGSDTYGEADGVPILYQSQASLVGLLFPVLVQLPIDSDNDGLMDWQEYMLGTDPLDPDTNHNGLLDGLDYYPGYNPAPGGVDPVSAAAARNLGANALDYYSPTGGTPPAPNSGAPIITLTFPPGVMLQP